VPEAPAASLGVADGLGQAAESVYPMT